MQIITLIKDQTFFLKELSMPKIHNHISASAAVCAATPLQAFTLREQGGIKLHLSWQRLILQLQGALSFTENTFQLLLCHLGQGKYSGF